MITFLPTEDQEQELFINWFKIKYKDVRIFAIPNGQLRNLLVAKKLKRLGVTPGIPDLYIPAWKVWIEMKRKKLGKVSLAQEDWKKYLEKIGDTVIIGFGCDDAIKKVEDYLGRKS